MHNRPASQITSQLGLSKRIGGGYAITSRERTSAEAVRLTFTAQQVPTTAGAGAEAAAASGPKVPAMAGCTPGSEVTLEVAAGPSELGVPDGCVLTPLHEQTLADMSQDHVIGRDLALVGPKVGLHAARGRDGARWARACQLIPEVPCV